MRITTETIKSLSPRTSKRGGFYTNYPNYNNTLKHFINLDEITYSDKVIIVTKLFTHKQNVKWAALCAESVLYLFESKHPNNSGPRTAIKASKNWLRNPTSWYTAMSAESAAWCADRAAVWAATKSAAYHAAIAAKYSARSAAKHVKYAARYAKRAADAAVKSAKAAAWPTESAMDARIAQENKNLQLMLKCI